MARFMATQRHRDFFRNPALHHASNGAPAQIVNQRPLIDFLRPFPFAISSKRLSRPQRMLCENRRSAHQRYEKRKGNQAFWRPSRARQFQRVRRGSAVAGDFYFYCSPGAGESRRSLTSRHSRVRISLSRHPERYRKLTCSFR